MIELLLPLLLAALPEPSDFKRSCAEILPDVGWVAVSKTRTSDDRVLSVDPSGEQPKRTSCVEAVFNQSGLDVVTESQWTLVLALVVSHSGRVERFKIVLKPPLNIDYEKPLVEALNLWRYDLPKGWEDDAAFCELVALNKTMGYRTSSACGDKP